MDQKRYLSTSILEDLKEKMVFVGGPRQVGKTTMALHFLKNGNQAHPAYLNWDFIETKKKLLDSELPANEKLIIFDEIHKYQNWRNLVKGFYDQYKSQRSFLVTGSARLDYYRRGGDSLQGRYYYYRLHPFTLSELNKKPNKNDIKSLLQFGGFPEPLFKQNHRHWKRWQKDRLSRVISDDLVNLEHVKEISQLNLITQMLPYKVGSPLSINNLKQDLSVAFETAERWIQILENLYYCFRILPYGPSSIRAAKKEKKLYLWDWSLCLDEGPRFENMVASHLLKYCHFIEDTQGENMELRFLRDSQKREIDFIVLKNQKPLFAVECKTGEKNISPTISYMAPRLKIPRFYQVHLGKKDVENAGLKTRVLPFNQFCIECGLV